MLLYIYTTKGESLYTTYYTILCLYFNVLCYAILYCSILVVCNIILYCNVTSIFNLTTFYYTYTLPRVNPCILHTILHYTTLHYNLHY